MKNRIKIFIISIALTVSSCSLKTNPAQKIAELFGNNEVAQISNPSNNDQDIQDQKNKSSIFSKYFTSRNSNLDKNTHDVNLLWSINIGDERSITSSILQLAYDNNNIIYTVDNSGLVSAIDIKMMDKIWSADLNIDVTSGLCYHRGYLFFGSYDGKLYGYNVENIEKNSGLLSKLDILDKLNDVDIQPDLLVQLKSEISSPAVGVGNIIYVKLGDGDTAAIDLDNSKLKWIHKGRNIPLSIKGTAAVATDYDNIFVARDDGNLISLTSDTGKLNWLTLISPRSGRNDLESLRDVEMIPLLDNSVLFVGSYQGNLVAIDSLSGNTIWKTPMSVHSNVNVDSSNLYVSSKLGVVYAVDRYDGSIKWKTSLDKTILYTEPHIINNKIVTFSTLGDIAILNKETGKLIHYENIIDPVDFQSDIYLIDKVLYILTKNGRLNAININ